jgi:hypothetical protein
MLASSIAVLEMTRGTNCAGDRFDGPTAEAHPKEATMFEVDRFISD